MTTRFRPLATTVAMLALLAGAAPVAGQSSPSPATPAPQTPTALTLAHSYTDAQPQHACGAQVIADGAAAADVALAIGIFGAIGTAALG